MDEQQVTEIPPFVSLLLSAFDRQFPGATIEVERIRAAGMNYYRIGLVSDQFEGVPFMKRQDLVWSITSSTIDDEEILRISMIVTITPEELRGEES